MTTQESTNDVCIDVETYAYLVEVERVARRIKSLGVAEYMLETMEDILKEVGIETNELKATVELLVEEREKAKKQLGDCIRS